MRKTNDLKSGFSLMEMMVVLLITAIVAAASAPMISKKMVKGSVNTSPWSYVGAHRSAIYNQTNLDDRTAYIGLHRPLDSANSKLFISSDNADNPVPHIGFMNNGNKLFFRFVKNGIYLTDSVPDGNFFEDNVAIGVGAESYSIGGPGNVAIGRNARASSDFDSKCGSVAIGNDAKILSAYRASVAVGDHATTNGLESVAIGRNASTTWHHSVALGAKTTAAQDSTSVGWGTTADIASVAVGKSATTAEDSVAIGHGASTTKEGGIAIGATHRWGTNKGGSNAPKTKSDGAGSVAIGYGVATGADGAIAIGGSIEPYFDTDVWKVITNQTKAEGKNSIAIGHCAKTSSHDGTIALGSGAKAEGIYTVALGLGANAATDASIAFGAGANVAANSTGAIAIGSTDGKSTHTTATGSGAIAIGKSATASAADHGDAIAIGQESVANGTNAIAIGWSADANGGTDDEGKSKSADNSIAIGRDAHATAEGAIAIGSIKPGEKESVTTASGENSVAIGAGAQATGKHSVAIGVGVTANHDNQIRLGNASSTVYIPGNLVVGKYAVLGANSDSAETFVRLAYKGGIGNVWKTEAGLVGEYYKPKFYSNAHDASTVLKNLSESKAPYGSLFSDRRLKNVGEVFKGGLAELKKLEIFNYTFKEDKDKTPHVGVIAQDLMKIFPDAVWKGEDGFYRIRMEDMFYAVINAIKELDERITSVADQVKSVIDRTDRLEAQVKAQQEVIDALQKQNADFEKQNAEFEKRLAKLEKKNKKVSEE